MHVDVPDYNQELFIVNNHVGSLQSQSLPQKSINTTKVFVPVSKMLSKLLKTTPEIWSVIPTAALYASLGVGFAYSLHSGRPRLAYVTVLGACLVVLLASYELYFACHLSGNWYQTIQKNLILPRLCAINNQNDNIRGGDIISIHENLTRAWDTFRQCTLVGILILLVYLAILYRIDKKMGGVFLIFAVGLIALPILLVWINANQISMDFYVASTKRAESTHNLTDNLPVLAFYKKKQYTENMMAHAQKDYSAALFKLNSFLLLQCGLVFIASIAVLALIARRIPTLNTEGKRFTVVFILSTSLVLTIDFVARTVANLKYVYAVINDFKSDKWIKRSESDTIESSAFIENPLREGTDIFQISDMRFGYSPDKLIFQEYCLTITTQQVTVVTGGNGAGKSTLLQLLIGAVRPIVGSVQFWNSSISLYKNPSAHLSYYNNNMRLMDGTVLENLAFGVENPDYHEIEHRLEELNFLRLLLKVTELEAVVTNGGRNLSHGTVQLVLLGRLLVENRDCLILDEPTSNLSDQCILGLVEIFRTMKKNGKTFVISTHDRHLIELADRQVEVNRC